MSNSKSEAFLFVHFIDKKYNTALSEQIYFSVSRDGLTWKTLNSENPVLISQVGERGIRDPFILRSKDGSRYYIIGTDLNVHLRPDSWATCTQNGSRDILVWESEDLINWSDVRVCTVAPEDAGCAWAPEAIYDEINDNYMVFWASKTNKGRGKHKIFQSRTKDFKTFTPPELYIERDSDVIDTDIIESDGYYYRFSKDETNKCILVERARSLDGEFETISSNLCTVFGVEDPQCFKLSDGRWCLLLDEYRTNNGYAPYVTEDLGSGIFVKDSEKFRTTVKFRHGGVIPISMEEYDRLIATYGANSVVKNVV
ncbi:MAG: glycoside hydrolase family 43 protein [Clostridia bacterium]|nr:glycoside hydrolase family 43 protein [Clostridia bacterium]